MKKWIRCIVSIHYITVNSAIKFLTAEKAITDLQNKMDNLVDRISQLEQTVQCLSDDNQQLIAKLYSKKGE